jgi:hypothetical protein
MVDITDAIFVFVSDVLKDTFGRLREAKVKYYARNKRPLGRKFNICSPSPFSLEKVDENLSHFSP